MDAYLTEALKELRSLGFVLSSEPSPLSEQQAGDDERFTPGEQHEISSRLEAFEATILQQFELSHEQQEWISREIRLLREELPESRKVTWRHLARSVLLGIATMIGEKAGRLVAEQAVEILRPYLGRWFPFLLGGGS